MDLCNIMPTCFFQAGYKNRVEKEEFCIEYRLKCPQLFGSVEPFNQFHGLAKQEAATAKAAYTTTVTNLTPDTR